MVDVVTGQRRFLGAIDVFVEFHAAAEVTLVAGQHAFEFVFRALTIDECDRRDGTGVDHGIARPTGARLETDRVESFTRRLDVDLAHDRVGALVFKRDAIGNGLGNRLNGESLARIAGLVDVAVNCHQRNAEPGGVGFQQFRDVAGDRAGVHACVLVVEGVEVTLKRIGSHGRGS